MNEISTVLFAISCILLICAIILMEYGGRKMDKGLRMVIDGMNQTNRGLGMVVDALNKINRELNPPQPTPPHVRKLMNREQNEYELLEREREH